MLLPTSLALTPRPAPSPRGTPAPSRPPPRTAGPACARSRPPRPGAGPAGGCPPGEPLRRRAARWGCPSCVEGQQTQAGSGPAHGSRRHVRMPARRGRKQRRSDRSAAFGERGTADVTPHPTTVPTCTPVTVHAAEVQLLGERNDERPATVEPSGKVPRRMSFLRASCGQKKEEGTRTIESCAHAA